MLRRQPSDKVAIPQGHSMRRDNKATIGLGRECRNGALDFGSVMHGKWENLYTE